MKLIVIGSNSSGNAYALDAGDSILLLEAGMKLKDVQKAIDFRTEKVVGCVVSHAHGDHAKYAEDYAKHGIKIYCNADVVDKKKFQFGTFDTLQHGKTVSVGSFRVSPIKLHHDIPNFGYIVYHKAMGCLLFASDTYKMDAYITGIDHWLIEANYDDRILKANIESGRIDRFQANRLMLSHLSLDNTVHYLRECHAENSKTITLCHISERNSCPKGFADRVAGELGVPVQVADKGVIVELNKEII